MYETAIAVCIGFTISNFIFEVFYKGRRDWGEAIKISLLQVAALGTFLFLTTIK